jgi:hypothetical protein
MDVQLNERAIRDSEGGQKNSIQVWVGTINSPCYSDDMDINRDASVSVGTDGVGTASDEDCATCRKAGTGAAITACCCGTTNDVSTGGRDRGVYAGVVGVDGEEGAGGNVGVGVVML